MRGRRWLLVVIILGAMGSARVCPASTADDDRFLAGLRQRQLYRLAESFCRQQLKRSGLSDQRLAELTIELSQTYADHALVAGGERRAQLWQQAIDTARDMIRQEPTSPRLVLVKVQLAAVQTRQARALLDEQELGAAIAWDPLRQLLREAIGQLQAAQRSVSEQLRRKRQGEVSGPGMLSADELVSLERHVKFELAQSLLVQARSYPAASPDRVSALTEADETLAPLAGRDEPDRLVWLSRLARIAAARLSGDAATARSREQELENAHPPADILAQARAELVQLELAADHVDEALKMVEAWSGSGAMPTAAVGMRDESGANGACPRSVGMAPTASPEWQYAVLSAYVARWQKAAQGEQTAESKAWQAKVEKQAGAIERELGLPWSRRAEMLIARVAAASHAPAQGGVLVKAAETFYRSGRTDEAVAALDRARQQADHEKQSQAAFDAGFTAAAIEHQQKHYAEASRRFRALAIEFPKNAKAAEAHLLAVFDTAQMTDANDAKSIAQYETVLKEQIEHWPQAESTSTARLWLGKLYESRRKWELALAAYRKIPQASPQYAEAIDGLARCWSAWLIALRAGGDEAAHFNPDDVARSAVAAGDAFYAIAAPGGRWPLEWTATQRAAAMAAAKIWLEVTDQRFEQAEAVLRAMPADEGDASWQQRSAPLLALALAGQRRIIQAGDLIAKLPPAGDDTSSLEIAAAGLDRLALAAADPARGELGELALAVCDRIVGRNGGLNDWQRQTVGLLRARALAAAGRSGDAREYLASLAHDFPHNQAIQQQYATELSDSSDPAQLHSALERWRALEQSNRPGTEAWFRAKYGLASTHDRLGNHGRAARIIELTQVLHPELGGSRLKLKFEQLLKQCTQAEGEQ